MRYFKRADSVEYRRAPLQHYNASLVVILLGHHYKSGCLWRHKIGGSRRPLQHSPSDV